MSHTSRYPPIYFLLEQKLHTSLDGGCWQFHGPTLPSHLAKHKWRSSIWRATRVEAPLLLEKLAASITSTPTTKPTKHHQWKSASDSGNMKSFLLPSLHWHLTTTPCHSLQLQGKDKGNFINKNNYRTTIFKKSIWSLQESADLDIAHFNGVRKKDNTF